MILTGISGSKHWRRTSITSSGLTVAPGSTWVVTPVSVSIRFLQGQARLAPRVRPAHQVDYILRAQRDRHLGRDRRAAAHRAHEDRPVLELVLLRRLQDVVQHDVTRAGDVSTVPFPVVSHVDHVIALVDELLHVVDGDVAERGGLFGHTYLLLLILAGQSIRSNLQHLERKQGALDARG